MAKEGYIRCVGLATILTVPLFAVSVPQSAAASEIEELVVTVRKREESIQDVPISISAFSADEMARRSMRQLEDIAQQTPGFNFEDGANGGFGLPTIRGASQFSSTALETNVSVFVDGLYIPRQYAFDLGLNDTSRIEIAKGPQNALFGRNAFMGAINYASNRPSLSEFEADAKVTYGDYDRRDYSVSLGAPIVEGKLGLRGYYGQTEQDGTWSNRHPNADLGTNPGTNGNLSGWDDETWSIAATFAPTDVLEFDLSYRSVETFNESRARYRIDRRNNGNANELNCGVVIPGSPGIPPIAPPTPALNTLWCGELPFLEERSTISDPRNYGTVTETDILRLGAGWDISDGFRVDYVFGNIKSDVYTVSVSAATDPLTEDNSAFGQNTSFSTPNGGFDYDSHELRFTVADGRNLSAMFGAFYSEGSDEEFQVFGSYPLYNQPGGTSPIPLPTIENSFGDLSSWVTTETDVWAIFGLFEYDGLLDGRGKLTLEARYTDEKKSQRNNLIDPVTTPVAADIQLLEDEYSYFTPRITFDYTISESSLLYVSASKGVLSGGFNGAPSQFLSNGFVLVDGEERFDTSSNWTYEIGSKNTVLDGKAQLNAAIYYIDWSDVQISKRPTIPPGLDPLLSNRDRDRITTIQANLGDVGIYGIEVDGSLLISDNLTFNAGGSLQEATYKNGTFSDRIEDSGACDDIVCSSNGDVGGNTLQRQSPVQLFAGLLWEADLRLSNFEGLGYYARADITYQSKQYTSEINTAYISDRTLVNASAGLVADQWELQLWVKNLFDEKYLNQAGNIFRPIDVGYTPTLGERRTVGATLSVTF